MPHTYLSGTARVTAVNSDLVARAQRVARETAAVHAADVDAKGRFPTETFEALRRERLLSAAVPKEFGGQGAGLAELAAQCAALAQGCGSSAMVLAMHHIQVGCIARHAHGAPWFRDYLQQIVEKQLLIASATSEVGTFGDTRSSITSVNVDGDNFTLDKDATTVSYGEAADAILITARRNKDAPASDQVLVLARKEDYALTLTTSWDTMGMRGTRSPGYMIRARGLAAQIVPGAFAESAAMTMVPYSHVLWSALWWGISADAVARASAVVRAEARKKPGVVPHSATRLAEVQHMLQATRHNWMALAAEFDSIAAAPGQHERLTTIEWALKMNNLKVASSEAAPAIVHRALQIAGVMGYKNDSPYALGRHYRDVLSASLMISNDRILQKTAAMLLVFKDDAHT